jgi:hypothetical protein
VLLHYTRPQCSLASVHTQVSKALSARKSDDWTAHSPHDGDIGTGPLLLSYTLNLTKAEMRPP